MSIKLLACILIPLQRIALHFIWEFDKTFCLTKSSNFLTKASHFLVWSAVAQLNIRLGIDGFAGSNLITDELTVLCP